MSEKRVTFRMFSTRNPDYRHVLYNGKLVGSAIKRDGEWSADIKGFMGFTHYRHCKTLKELAARIE